MSEPVIGTPTPAADPTSDGWAAPPARVSVFRASVSEILAACREELAADRATVFFVEPDGAELCSFVIDGTDLSEIRVSTTRGVAAEVLQTGVPVAISDAYADPRFDPSIDQRSGYRTTRIACVPIVTRAGTRWNNVDFRAQRCGVEHIFL